MNILQINSSARRLQDDQGSVSTRLANELSAGLRAANPAATLTVRDFAVNPLPVLDEAGLGALFTPVDARTPEQTERVALNDQLIAELFAADAIVIGAPMINFSISAQLKNWIDAIARAGVTFKYGESGPVGLVTGKKVYVVSSRGGIHRDQPRDQVVSYLRTVLAFLGMTDVEFIYAEGLNMGPEAADRGLSAARAQISELLTA
ncbi:FMN-dependent NADH-azoreductase [Roseateles saccharophilus]|uniref:FMN dependent NADH:quinone oxidoreductase n=1 Tax=Roseateles saccharophilus TaxID=304 RepID=A0A4R3V7L9_ROSSA|nr:FMN-dependent NADH-azoreductase [Roseateles saccharophilus]MDG0835915.1 FMN-dependent NADH-azoreductase [Roseateles saccharophilus]TCV01117.1 FMN-dependent NADH-azoreductase [Roseateles saccharophilus]